MNVLLIARCSPYPLHLGDRLILWHLARELQQRGVTLDLLAFAQSEQDWQETAHYASFFRHVQLLHEPVRHALHYLQRIVLPAARFPRHAEAAWSPEMWRAIETQLQQQKYDVVHLFGSVQVYEFYHALGGRPALITPYESYSLFLARQIAQQGGIANRIRRIITQQFERFMFTPYASTVVVAPPDQAELLRLNPHLRVEVISNGIDLDYFTGRTAQPENPTLLFVGNFEYAPNVDAAQVLAKQILPQVRQHIPAARLLLVGNAPPPEIQALADDHITITGRVPDIRPYHMQASAFVCPLRVGAGIKNKVLEALAMGVPVVATLLSVDGIDVQHNHSALIADVDAMAGEIVRLLRDSTLQQNLAQNGRALIETQYSWGSKAEAYHTLYRQISAEQG
jgi:polysaccharide biosynthesis protein PslH